MKRLLTARDQSERALFWHQAGMSPEEELAQGVGVERWRKLTYPDLDLDHNAFNRLPEEERRRFAQEYDEYVRNLDQKGKMRLSRRTAAEDAADPQLQSYLDQAQKNLMATSRTAQGVIDTSASPDKADQMHDISGDQAASLAANNYRDVIARAYADRNRQFGSPQEVRDFVEGMAAQVNGGIFKGPLLREHDSDKYPYTPVAQLPQAADEFYTQLHQRLNDPAADPIDTAAWAEYHVNPGHHFFGDGAGKTSKALSSYILMRNGLPLPTYPGGNEEYFKNVTRTIPIGQDPQADEESLNNFLRYYRSMMPQATQAPMTVTGGRTLWASFCREWGVGTTHRRASIHDHMYELDDDGMPRWLDDPYERSHAQALRDLGEERSFAQYLADRAYNNFMDIEKGPDENLAETWWGRSGQADDYLRSLGGEV